MATDCRWSAGLPVTGPRSSGRRKAWAAGAAASSVAATPASRMDRGIPLASGRAAHICAAVLPPRRNAEDEDTFGREEALQADRHGQGACSACLHLAHSREEEPEAEAPSRQARDDFQGRRAAGQGAPGSEEEVTRVKRSTHARKKRRKTLDLAKGYRGEAHSNYKRAKEAVMKADSYAYRDRRNRKRDFRRLWITRINAAARQNGMSYGTFMHGLKLAGIELDRKVLADIAVRDAETFSRFADAAREASSAAA